MLGAGAVGRGGGGAGRGGGAAGSSRLLRGSASIRWRSASSSSSCWRVEWFGWEGGIDMSGSFLSGASHPAAPPGLRAGGRANPRHSTSPPANENTSSPPHPPSGAGPDYPVCPLARRGLRWPHGRPLLHRRPARPRRLHPRRPRGPSPRDGAALPARRYRYPLQRRRPRIPRRDPLRRQEAGGAVRPLCRKPAARTALPPGNRVGPPEGRPRRFPDREADRAGGDALRPAPDGAQHCPAARGPARQTATGRHRGEQAVRPQRADGGRPADAVGGLLRRGRCGTAADRPPDGGRRETRRQGDKETRRQGRSRGGRAGGRFHAGGSGAGPVRRLAGCRAGAAGATGRDGGAGAGRSPAQ